jgi:hypothetical protein
MKISEVLPDPNAIVKTLTARKTSTSSSQVNKPVGTTSTTGTQQQTTNTDATNAQQSQDTIGKDTSQNNQPLKFMRGDSVQLPVGNNKMGDFKIKSVIGQEVELENPDKKIGEPSTIKYNKDKLNQMLTVMQNGQSQ